MHYSFVYEVLIRHRKAGPRIWQITSSGIKNEFPKTLLEWFDRLNRWLYSPRSPLNWFTKRRRMRIVPYTPEHAEAGERLWNSAGIGQVFQCAGTAERDHSAQFERGGEDADAGAGVGDYPD